MFSTIKTTSGRSGATSGASLNGNILKASALACWLDVLKSIMYSYAANFQAQRCIQLEAWDLLLFIEQGQEGIVVRLQDEVVII